MVIGLAILIGCMIAFAPTPAGTPRSAMVALAITALTVVLWATIVVPQPTAALVFLLLVVLSGAASPRAVASGFLSNSLWLVYGGLLIGTAADKTGFGRLVARQAIGSFRGSFGALVAGVLAGSTVLAFLVPATMGRIAITVPVVMALAREAGYEPGSNGYVGLVVAAVIGNFMIALAILPGNLLNIMVVGSGETLYGMRISYMKYLLLMGPVLGLVKGIVCWWTITTVYPAPSPQFAASPEQSETLGTDAMRVGLILAGAIALWATDFWHGLNPGVVALAAGIACMVPGLGPLSWREGLDPRKLLIMLWVGTVLGIGAVLSEAGASRVVSGALADLAMIDGRGPLYAYGALVILASLTGIMTTIGGAIPIVTTAVGGFSTATGMPIETGVLTVVVGLSSLAFPYIAAPIMVGLAMGKVSARAATRFTLASSLLTLVIVVPLNALWWRWLGALP
jgi:di/tricarboxylate transporter